MVKDIYKEYERCVDFHGHRCGGLAIGVRAAVEAEKLLKLTPWGTQRTDEEVVCISENDACGVDGIQVILGCTPGKGSLKFEVRGKMAFNIYNRDTGESVRLCLKAFTKEDAMDYFYKNGIAVETSEAKTKYTLEAPLQLVFDVGNVQFPLPKKAPSYNSIICQGCGESTAQPYIADNRGKLLCMACREGQHEV